jgi:hypothetical protein
LSAWISGALTISAWLAPALAHAELVPRPDARRVALQGTLALEPELTLSAGLLFPLRLDSPRAALSLGAGVKWAALLPTRGDLQLSLGAAGSYLATDHWTGLLALGSLFARQDQGLLLAFNLAQLPIYLELGAGYAW